MVGFRDGFLDDFVTYLDIVYVLVMVLGFIVFMVVDLVVLADEFLDILVVRIDMVVVLVRYVVDVEVYPVVDNFLGAVSVDAETVI